MRLNELLIQYEIQTNKSHSDVAKEVGVSLSTYYRWLGGDCMNLRKTKIKRLSEVLNCDVEQVIEEMHKVKPILGKVKAGYDLWAEQDFEGYVEVGSKDAHNGDYFLRVTGDSMIDKHIFEDDLVYVKQCQEVSSGSIAIVLIGDEVTIKTVKYTTDGMILEPGNAKYDTRFFTYEQVAAIPIQIIGKVQYVRRDL